MLITTVEEAGRSPVRAARLSYYARYWACVAGVALSDAISFALRAGIFRIWQTGPKVYVAKVLKTVFSTTPDEVGELVQATRYFLVWLSKSSGVTLGPRFILKSELDATESPFVASNFAR